MTPTIIIQHADEHRENGSKSEKGQFFSEEVEIEVSTNNNRASRCFNENFENSVQSIESSINKYFQVVTLSNSFDLSKIIDVRNHF